MVEIEREPLVARGMERGAPGVSASDYVPTGISREEYERLRKKYLGTSPAGYVHQVLWILGALFLIYFGNGSADLVNLMFRDVRVIGWARAGWAACFLGNVGIYIYVSWILWAVHKREVDYEEVPWSLPVATVLGFGATGFFCIALWPVFHILVFPVFYVLFMGMFMALTLLPSDASEGAKAD